jgi:hypothetical protein
MSEVRQRANADRTPSYDGRRFRLTLTGGVPTSRNVVLECRQHGEVVVGAYTGDHVEHGVLLAIVRAMGCLEGRFQHVTESLRLETGRCWATPQLTSGGHVRLYVEWHMGGKEGVSVMEEMGM